MVVWVTGDRVPGLGCAEDVGSTVLLSVGAVDSKIKVGREESVQYHLHLLVQCAAITHPLVQRKLQQEEVHYLFQNQRP